MTFNGTSAGAATFWSATMIAVTVPSGASTGNLVVTVGGVASNGVSFRVQTTTPSISSVSPATGAAGVQVTISGSGFGSAKGTGTVWLGSTSGRIVSWSDTQVVATVASNSRSGTARVQQDGAWSNAVPFNVVTATISNVAPASGVPGTQVTIAGSGFGAEQGSGQVWLGTAKGVVQSWSDTQVVAVVATGSTSGNAQLLQNGVLSNAVQFDVNTLHITSVSPASGGPGTSVTFTGAGFGSSQGTGTVLLGSTAGQVLSWSDTQVVAAVAPTALTGIARIQKDGVWSNAADFTVPVLGGNTVKLTPNLLNLVVGDTHTIQAISAAGQPVTGLTWTSSDPNVVTLSSDAPPLLSALAAGHVTITAGTASADVTVSAGDLPLGTVLWSSPGDPWIVPAVPSPSGVADVFAFPDDGSTVRAITSDGTIAWTADVSQAAPWGTVVPDFQGGLVLLEEQNGDWTHSSIVKLDGITGQRHPLYTPGQPSFILPPLGIHTDGTIFAIQYNRTSDGADAGESVIGIDPASGAQKFSVSIPGGVYGDLIIAGDGYAYVPCGSQERRGPEVEFNHLMLLRVDSAGAHDYIQVLDWAARIPVLTEVLEAFSVNMITNADQGILLTWDSYQSGDPIGMAITTGTSVSLLSAPQIPGGGPLVPVLQAQDGSFVGTVEVEGGYGEGYIQYMIAFDATGNLRWSLPNYDPRIATADGGVIAISGDGSAVTFDQNGSATGQMASLLTQSWLGNLYQDGPLDQVLAIPSYIATTFAPFAFANASGNRTSVREDWFPPLDHCTTTPGCIGHHEAIYNALSDLVHRLADPTVGRLAQTKVFDKLGNDANGNKLTTSSFIGYLTAKRPGFYDATRSGYCYDALSPMDEAAFCNSWWGSLITQSIANYFDNNLDTGAVTGTPTNPLRTWVRPSTVAYSSLGRNLRNEGLIFHEALHGMTGLVDNGRLTNTQQLEEKLGLDPFGPSCEITVYIQNTVLSHSPGLDPFNVPCP